jgi:hypothetical protein
MANCKTTFDIMKFDNDVVAIVKGDLSDDPRPHGTLYLHRLFTAALYPQGNHPVTFEGKPVSEYKVYFRGDGHDIWGYRCLGPLGGQRCVDHVVCITVYPPRVWSSIWHIELGRKFGYEDVHWTIDPRTGFVDRF